MNWSYSKWGAYRKCPALFKFKYLVKAEEAKSPYAQRGLDKHKIIENFLLGNLADLPSPLDYYFGFLTSIKEQGVRPEQMYCLDDRWQVVEKDSPNVWLKAVLDAVVVFPKTAIVYDWKSGKIYDDHAKQREVYALCVFAENPEVTEVQSVSTYIDLMQNRSTGYHRDQIPPMMKKWENEVKLMMGDDVYPANPGFHCKWCGFSRSNKGPCKFG